MYTLPYYSDLLAWAELRHCARAILHNTAQLGPLVITLERRNTSEHYSPNELAVLNAVLPTLAAACKLAEMNSYSSISAMVAAWDMVGRPCALLGPDGHIMETSKAFDDLPVDCLSVTKDGLSAKAHDDNRRLQLHMAAALRRPVPERLPDEGPLALRQGDGTLSLLVHVIPLMGHATVLLGGASVLVVATDIRRKLQLAEPLLASLFGLTRSETNLVKSMLEGRSILETARDQGLSRETIRTHLKSVFAKCGVSRQSDLMLLTSQLCRESAASSTFVGSR